MVHVNNPVHLNNTGDLALKLAQIVIISFQIATLARIHPLTLSFVQNALMDIHFQITNVLLAHMAVVYVLQLQIASSVQKDLQ